MPLTRHLGLIAGVLLVLSSDISRAEELSSDLPPNSLWTRPTLFDGPGSPKDALRKHGINLDLWWTQFYQGLAEGDGDKDWQYGGKGDIIANVDLHRLFGFWPGLSVNVHQEFLYGEDANTQGDGTLIPVNTALAFPRLGGFERDTSIVVTQRFGNRAALSVGKFNMLDPASRRPLIGGAGLDTFQNLGVAAPISGVTPPYLVGASLSLFTKPVSFSLFVYDPRNAQDFDVVENPFSEATTWSLTATLPTRVGGLNGSHSVRGVYSSEEGVDLIDIPQLFVPPVVEEDYERDIGTKKGYWYASYSFYQYLWQSSADPTKGWGVFGEAAISDGNPNPLLGHWYIGLGGNSPIPNRIEDLWGVVYVDYRISDTLRTSVRDELGIRSEPERGVEAYYNVAVTPWFRLTGDVQVINPVLSNKDTSVFTGLRSQVRF